MDALATVMRDATGSVALDDARAVGEAVEIALRDAFGADSISAPLLHAAFDDVERLFAGERAGYLACDMPYHDMRHSLDTALVMARLLAGYQRRHDRSGAVLHGEHAVVGVVLALLHDIGFIRRASEASLSGPQLTREHESRSIEFARKWLASTPLAAHAPLAALIRTTDLDADLDAVFAHRDAVAVLLGRMVGSADLVSQLSDRSYPERCYYHLYPELVLGGCDRVRHADGSEELLYRDAVDFICKTTAFYDTIVRGRLSDAFRRVTAYLALHFDGSDPYADAIRANLDRVARIGEDGALELLGNEPPSTTHALAPIYHASRPRPPGAH